MGKRNYIISTNPTQPYLKFNVLDKFQLLQNRPLFILKWKNCQENPPGILNVFNILVIHTDNAQVIFVLIEVCQPGGAAINFSKIALKSKSDNTFTSKEPFVTPNFCKRNLSEMHHFKTVNIFSFKIAPVWDCDQVRGCLKPEQFWK